MLGYFVWKTLKNTIGVTQNSTQNKATEQNLVFFLTLYYAEYTLRIIGHLRKFKKTVIKRNSLIKYRKKIIVLKQLYISYLMLRVILGVQTHTHKDLHAVLE